MLLFAILLATGSVLVTSETCTGNSAKLPASECQAWLDIWDHWNLGNIRNRGCAAGRTDPCDSPTCAYCTYEGNDAHISGIDLGDRGLTGSIPVSISKLTRLSYLMLAANDLMGALPSLNYSQFQSCGGSKYVTQGGLQLLHPGPQDTPDAAQYRDVWPAGECCFMSSTADAGIRSQYDCPIPEGAKSYCNAVCGNTKRNYSAPDPALRGGASVAVDPPPRPSPTPTPSPGACNSDCSTPSNSTYPICDVEKSLNFGNRTLWRVGGITEAYCNDKYLVVWADGIPNHEVYLEEIPKPPGTNTDEAYPYSGNDQGALRTWKKMDYTYVLPLSPELASSVTTYTGFGAMAMAVNGIPMYPDDSTSGVSTKEDQQLDHCNEHAGKGADVHYHGDPSCMYDNTVPTLVGYAGDGFEIWGILDPDTGKVPTDLDECSGHAVTLVDGSTSYRYHTQKVSPFTVTCWSGKPAPLWSNGAQWNYDNSMGRTDWNEVLPCCK